MSNVMISDEIALNNLKIAFSAGQKKLMFIRSCDKEHILAIWALNYILLNSENRQACWGVNVCFIAAPNFWNQFLLSL